MNARHPVIVAALGADLGVDTTRRRAVPRITARAARTIQSDPAFLEADHDACFLDDTLIVSPADWRMLIDAGRLADVEGAFVMAWTDASGRLHLARDGVGGRTLFYAETDQGLVYGASIAAVLDTGLVPRRIDRASIATYLCYAYLPGRETLAQSVMELLPGEQVTVGRDGMRRSWFWRLPAQMVSTSSEADLARDLRAALEKAMRRLLPPPGEPVGAFLSGGLDSSLVVALAARLHDAPIHSFSVSFGAGHANELAFSSMVADHCDTNHSIVELTPAAVLAYLDQSIALLSDPIGDPLTVPNALLFREAARHAGIVLNGEGGDPCFGGPKNLPMLLAELYGDPGEPGTFREASYLRAHLKCYDDLAEMLLPSVAEAVAARPLEPAIAAQLNDPDYPNYVARLQATNIRIKGAHHILPKVDSLSAPFGVVPRAALFDRAVVELSLRIPARLKLKGTIEKYLLKEAVRDLLPAAIIERPKSGMLVPVESWCRGPLLQAARERLLDGLAPYELIRRDYLERLLAGKLGGLRPRHGAKIWLLLTLEAWLRCVLQPAG